MKILLVDDEAAQRKILHGFLVKKNYAVEECGSAEEAISKLAEINPDIVCTDYKMDQLSGLDLLKAIKKFNPKIEVLVMTAFGSIEQAVECMKNGAHNYLTKPINLDELILLLDQIKEKIHIVRENEFLKEQISPKLNPENLIYKSDSMQTILSVISRVAKSNSSVLIRGESGTGKEVIARILHSNSDRANEKFVAINCGAIPENLVESEFFGHEKGSFTGADKQKIGKFEFANKGTLFLDEIGDLPLQAQVKILRVLQEHVIERIGGNGTIPVDLRIVAATHQPLEKLIAEGKFREDLFYRLNVIVIDVPPLRERKEDILPIADHYLQRFCAENKKSIQGFDHETQKVLLSYHYPGNIRELENIILRSVLLARENFITPNDLPIRSSSKKETPSFVSENETGDLNQMVEELEMKLINNALLKSKGVQTHAAELLNLSERTLRFKLQKYDIDSSKFKDK